MLGEAYVELRGWRKGGGVLPEFATLELIRREGGLSVARFCARLGIRPSTWYYWHATLSAGS